MRNPLTAPTSDPRRARALTRDDLARVIEIDKLHAGHLRRHFFEKRFGAAAARPDDYLQVGVTLDDRLQGFAIARVLRGEYGQRDAVAVVDALGVAPDSREKGIGQALMRALVETSREQGVRRLQSQANWTNDELLRFFDAAHFELAARIALERPIADLRAADDEET